MKLCNSLNIFQWVLKIGLSNFKSVIFKSWKYLSLVRNHLLFTRILIQVIVKSKLNYVLQYYPDLFTPFISRLFKKKKSFVQSIENPV